MVKVRGGDEYERLDALLRELCERHGLKLSVQGWARKTYDVHREDRRTNENRHLVRVESFATTSGEIRIYEEEALPFAEELGAALEREFGLAEATIIRAQA